MPLPTDDPRNAIPSPDAVKRTQYRDRLRLAEDQLAVAYDLARDLGFRHDTEQLQHVLAVVHAARQRA